MDKSSVNPDDVLTRLPGRADVGVLRTALSLAGAFAFQMGEEGTLIIDDPDALHDALFAGAAQLDLTQRGWEARLSGDDVRARRQAIAGLTWEGARAQLDYDLVDAQGGTRHFRETLEAVAVHDGNAVMIRGVLLDRTIDAENYDKIAWTSRHDPLTGLPNRAVLIETMDQAASLSRRVDCPAQFVRVRLFGLTMIAETYGMETADRVLKQVSDRLRGCVRRPDIAARLSDQSGGHDFGLCLFAADTDAVAKRLQTELGERPYQSPFGPLYLDIGLVDCRLRDGAGLSDAALRQTRESLDGVARPNLTSDHTIEISAQRVSETNDTNVLAALESDRISLAFQPIVDARTRETVHQECLLRLRGKDGRMISAGAIVCAAERDGLVHRLDRRALALATPHLLAHPDLHLALNVSAGTLSDPVIADAYIAEIRALGAAATRLTLELTETLAVDDPTMAARFSAEARALGCRFAVDDFGSGYTTFRNLMAIEADSIKIDGTLVRGIALDDNKQTFIRMMVDLAQTFSVKTVAEMVETGADAEILRRLGVDYLQGYYFGVPAAAPVWSRLTQGETA